MTQDTTTADTTFVDDLGADSLDIFQIIMGMEEEYDIEIGERGSRADPDSRRCCGSNSCDPITGLEFKPESSTKSNRK